MKLFKSLLLASATGLVAVSGASAADLGAKKPSPVEYVRACYNPLWGTSGGFIIPGTQTCLRVFGQARFDYQYSQPFARNANVSGWRGGMTVGLDAVTPSEYGNVRTFASIGAVYRSGNQFSGTNVRQNLAIANPTAGGVNLLGAFPAGQVSAGQTEINYTGFIQFAGFTMGRTASFFQTVGSAPEIIGLNLRSGPGNVTTIAYTANLGNGFLATIALEDPTIRRFGVAQGSFIAPGIAGVAGGAAAGTFVSPNIYAPFGTSSNVGNGTLVPAAFNALGTFQNQIGNRMPTIVAALRVDQAWGSAELSGMVNEVGIQGFAAGANNALLPGTLAMPSSKYGFAINGGLKINLPMLAAGSNLTLNGVYSEGNLSAVVSNGLGGSFGNFNVGGVAVSTVDAVATATGGLRLTKAWGISGGLQHFWTPTLSSTLFGSYGQVDVPNTPLSAADSLRDWTYWNVGINTVWQPVRGLNIALEGAYIALDPKGRVVDVNKNTLFSGGGFVAGTGCVPGAVAGATAVGIVPAATCRTKSSDGQFLARLRVTRDF